ncbi:hypothetical protein J8L98_00425 [Pseudoalteromonas sp. MMG013]|uniref:hypothetical protein n=1 Tax=Pseudoalteromonas sp. MMG013 TaxID=2822687 RepID=UPI001B375FC1|nr:hypothetical protein [Pseudoalteromonas sp. MMG013]MBQ4860153.1 hypothetical protein [Pseudoalteromonas sp. MMG013]
MNFLNKYNYIAALLVTILLSGVAAVRVNQVIQPQAHRQIPVHHQIPFQIRQITHFQLP